MGYIMAIDQGTTSSRCILFDTEGEIKSVAQKEFRQIYPVAGWVEHDPEEIWESQLAVCREAMDKLGVTAGDILAIGITNQRETTIVWDRDTGKPVYNAIVWQCRRTAEQVDGIFRSGHDSAVREKTGLIPDAYFSATKIKWILDSAPGLHDAAKSGKLCFGTVDSWLLWKLSGGKIHLTDMTNASRTMLYNIFDCRWDDALLDYFGIPGEILPGVRPSCSYFGDTDPALLGGAIPVYAMAGDQHAALFGQCCFDEGSVKNTYGTGCFLLMNTGEKPVVSQNSLITTIAAGFENRVEYALEGSVFVGGAVLQWLRDELKLISSAPEADRLAESVEDTQGVYIVPAFTGLGAPYWDQYARGTIVGLTRGCRREHFARAALESIAYQTHDVLRAMENDTGRPITGLRADGGASVSDFLMQFQADVLNAEVICPTCRETTALGAAYMAGLGAGVWKDRDELRKYWRENKRYAPHISEEIRSALLAGWEKAVGRSRSWAD